MSDSDLEFKRQLDSLCDEFEQNWSVESRSEIPNYLDRVGESFRDQLLERLIALDVDRRKKEGLSVSKEDYLGLSLNDEVVISQFSDLNHSGEFGSSPLVLDESAGETTASNTSVPRYSRQIGPYKLLRPIGEGGMGEVWMAEQEKPVRRRVALKIIKPSKVDKQLTARFEAERQALAMMDHQNIAKILDAGKTIEGIPYLVMELVQGIPITEYCDRNKLNLRERLELFTPVCKAIQHAHQKSIIHRDLKPANVLVCIIDGKPVSKVIDFGLAKALQQQIKLTDKTLVTELGQVIGTIRYMSPEQAKIDALDIDTRTDIYSLGVMLYELLSGSTPIDQETINHNALFKILEIIREKDPQRPSHRLSSTKHEIKTISECRNILPSKLEQILRNELDWIVMKALEKDRTRRYETANDFAEDIERYLSGDPVHARPPSNAYKIKKFVHKNRNLVATLLTILLFLLAGISGTSWFAWEANKQKTAAEEAEISARRNEEIAISQKVEAERTATLLRAQQEIANQQDKKTRELLIRMANTLKGKKDLFDEESFTELSNIYNELFSFVRLRGLKDNFVVVRTTNDHKFLSLINKDTQEEQVARERERCRIELLFPEKRYLMVIGITPDNRDGIIFPRKDEPNIADGFILGARSDKLHSLDFREHHEIAVRKGSWHFSDGIGVHAFLVISSKKQLPKFESVRQQINSIEVADEKIKSRHWLIIANKAVFPKFTNQSANVNTDSNEVSYAQKLVDAISFVFPGATVDGVVFNVDTAQNE